MYLAIHETKKYLQAKLNVRDIPCKIKETAKKEFLIS